MPMLRSTLALATLALAGCGSVNSMLGGNSEADALGALKWSYAQQGIVLDVHGDPDLNRASDQAHTVTVVLVQLTDPKAFTNATASPAALGALLMAPAAPDGMLGLTRLYAAPGSQQSVTLPRFENAQYVGVAVGYQSLDPARSTRLYRIGVDITAKGLMIKNRSAAPEPLRITLQLGPDGIVDSPGTKAVIPPPQRPQGGLVAPPAVR